MRAMSCLRNGESEDGVLESFDECTLRHYFVKHREVHLDPAPEARPHQHVLLFVLT